MNISFDRFFTLFCSFWMIFGAGLIGRMWLPFAASLILLSVWAGRSFLRGARPVFLTPALIFGLAALLSLAANPDILWESMGWLSVALFGLAALFLGTAIGEDRLLNVLYPAGWIWLALWPIPRLWGWVDNRNLLGFFPIIAILVILAKGKPWWWALPHAFVLVYLGSRGAILGLCVGLFIWRRPRLNFRRAALLLVVGTILLASLIAIRPKTALNRLSYWEQAGNALVSHNIWFGLGPWGVSARKMILEPGAVPGLPQSYHAHAHNFLVQALVEFGLTGGAALILCGYLVLKSKVRWSWQLPVLIAILIHCLVDFPIYYPGPLMLFMMIAGSVRREQSDKAEQRATSPERTRLPLLPATGREPNQPVDVSRSPVNSQTRWEEAVHQAWNEQLLRRNF